MYGHFVGDIADRWSLYTSCLLLVAIDHIHAYCMCSPAVVMHFLGVANFTAYLAHILTPLGGIWSLHYYTPSRLCGLTELELLATCLLDASYIVNIQWVLIRHVLRVWWGGSKDRDKTRKEHYKQKYNFGACFLLQMSWSKAIQNAPEPP